METLLISFGAGVAPPDCTGNCSGAGVIGPWLLGTAVLMLMAMLADRARAVLRRFVREDRPRRATGPANVPA